MRTAKVGVINEDLKNAIFQTGDTYEILAKKMGLSREAVRRKINRIYEYSFTVCERYWLSQHYNIPEDKIV